VADFFTGEFVKSSAFTPKNVPLLSGTKVFRIFETMPLDVEFDSHLALDADEILQMEQLVNSVVPGAFPGVPELDEFAFAPERAFIRMDENGVRVVVPVEELTLVARVVELSFVFFVFLYLGWTQLLGQGRGNIKFGFRSRQGLRC
jgi:hypothetical protein